MIIGKRLLALLICLVLCTALLISCGKDTSSDALSRLETLGGADAQSFDEYRIIISPSCTENVAACARELSDAISGKTGNKCVTLFDNSASAATDECFTVLLGNTAFDETKNAFVGLRRDDYVCKLYDNTLVLGGRSDSATACAVDKYIDEILPECEPTEIFCDGGEFEYHCDYGISELLLCGFELDKYVFVCGNNRASYDLTRSLREIIADRCGYYPDILCESKKSERREISVLIDDGLSSLAKIEYDGEDVSVTSDSIYGLSVASEKLYGMLFDGAVNGKVSMDIPYTMSYTYVAPRIELLNVVSDIPLNSNGILMAQELATIISNSGGDVVTFGAPMDIDLLNPLKNALDSRYHFLNITLSDGSILPLILDTSEYSVDKDDWSDSNGLVRRELSLAHRTGGHKFTVVSFFVADGAVDCAGTVKSAFENTDDARIAVFASSTRTDTFDVVENGISVEYNSLISAGELRSRYGVFCSTHLLECSEANVDTSSLKDTCLVNIGVEKRYCDAFFELIASKNIYN